ncbi:MAG: S-methyl-5'-thioinosine phosphorylase [Gammaproteobacteria bacterium]
MTKLAIIGGTGLARLHGMEIVDRRSVDTPYGKPSADLVTGRLEGRSVVFLARHGNPHSIPPHKINYRANIRALKDFGVESIVAVAAVGGITPKMPPRRIAVPDQIIDYSYGRKHTFFEDDLDAVTHIDFTRPYNETLRTRLIACAATAGLDITADGVYGCTQGPRLETAAEIARMERDGCDLVGMTGMPEAALARELEMDYAAVAVSANWAAGKSDGEITMEEITAHLEKGMADVELLLKRFIPDFS